MPHPKSSPKGRASNNYVPTDYEDLYKYYIVGQNGQSLAKSIVYKFLPYATQDEVEHLLSDIFHRILEKEILWIFDPNKANFGGAIYFVSRTICVNYLSRKGRDPLGQLRAGSLVETDTESDLETFTRGVYAMDRTVGADPSPDPESRLFYREFLSQLENWAYGLYQSPRHKRDASLYPLLKKLEEDRDYEECASDLGVTVSTIRNWVGEIRRAALEIQQQMGTEINT